MSDAYQPDVNTDPAQMAGPSSSSPEAPETSGNGPIDPNAPAPPAPDMGTQPAAPPQMGQQAPPAAPQQPDKPGSLWKNVLEGALRGLAGGGVVGAAIGAVDPKLVNQPAQMRQQQAQASIRFKDAQAAQTLAETTMRQHQIDQMDAQLKQQQVKDQEDRAQHLMDTGNSPLLVLPDDKPETLQAGLQHVANQNGGTVGQLFALRYGNGYAVFDGEKMNNSNAALQDVNLVRSLTGQQEIPLSSWMSKGTPTAVKSQWNKQANDTLYPTPEAGDKLNGQIATQNSLLGTAKALPDDNPNKQRLVDQFTKNTQRLGAAQASRVAEKYNLQAKEMEARGKAIGEYRIVQQLDPDTGTLQFKFAKDAIGSSPAQVGMTAQMKTAQLDDMSNASKTLRGVVQNMQPLSSGEVANIAYAIRSGDSQSLLAMASTGKVGKELLNPQQQQYVIWQAQLTERAMALRSVAGIGQAGSDKLREAVVQTLPMPNDTPELMVKKLDAFDQQVGILRAGIPGVVRHNGQTPAAPASPAAPNAAQGGDPFVKFGGTAHRQPQQPQVQ
jgi:hypothetical protein